MAQQIINYGNTANDGTGDPLRDAFIKVDDNFDQVWAAGPVGSNITILNNTISVVNTNGNLILSPNGIGVIQTNSKVLPRLDNTYDLGSANLRYRSMFVGAGGITTNGNLTLSNIANLRIPGGENGYVIQTDGDDNLSWVAMPGAGNGSPGGANTQVQFNDSGLFGGSGNLTFNKTTSALALTGTFSANVVAVTDGTANSWVIDGSLLRAPSSANWQSDTTFLDDYINGATDGFLNFQTFDSASNLAVQFHMEHGLAHINILNGVNYQWEFNDTGLFSAPGNITANGNITASYFLGDGSQLGNLAGGVIQGNIPPENPNDTTLWWDDITGRLYVWYTDVDGSQWVDAAPAAPASTYGNANVSSYLASGTISTAISTTGNVSGNYFIGNGSQLTNLPFDASQIENGTSNVAIATANGNVTITSAGAETWTFGTSGNLRFPDGTTYTGSEIDSPAVPTVGGLASAGEAGITYLSGDLSKWAIFSESAFTVGVWTDVLIGWTVTDNEGFTDIIASRGGFGAASFQTTVNSWPAPASGKTYVFTSPDYQPGYTNPVEITVGSSTWTFGNTSTLTLPGGSQLRPLGANLDIFAGAGSYVNLITADESSSMGVDNGGGYIVTAGGTWDFGTTGNLTAPGNVSAVGNIVGGNLTVGSGTITGGNVNGAVFNGNVAFGTGTVGGSGNIAGGNISAVGNVTVSGNLTVAGTAGNVATKSSGTWTVPTGNSTQSFTVDGNNTYQMWVEGNIPNGIIAWNALVTITNNNVPVLGQQFAWNYEGAGNPIMLTSIPDQIIGTAGAISNAAPVVANTNVFTFGINNSSGSSQPVRYGWIRIS